MSSEHALYRFYDIDGRLLYIGISLNPGSRWKQHRDDKPWWHDVAQVTVERLPSRQVALAAEQAAIVAERPRYNIIHNRSSDRIESTGGWGSRAADMPDDCHDHCAKSGIYSIYYPHRWRDGVAHYTCQAGHRWTCGWGHKRSGDAPECASVQQSQGDREHLTTREIAQIERALSTPGHYGGVL